MFTGLVEEIGSVDEINKGLKSASITVKAAKILKDISLGDSISVNGICLTVISFTEYSFTVDVMPETLRKTNLNSLIRGDKVNLERAMRLGYRFGGHIVSGHIDGVGIIANILREDNAIWFTIKASNDELKYIITKGSIAVDGISLTVAEVNSNSFKVSIIPMTKEETILSDKKVGDVVNIECDLIGKYIYKFTIADYEKKDKKIDMEFLEQNGFLN